MIDKLKQGDAMLRDGVMETYDLTVEREAYRLAANPNSTAEDRAALARTIVRSGRELADYIIAKAAVRKDP